MHAKGAKLPFSESFIFDPLKNTRAQFKKFRNIQKLYRSIHKNLRLYKYESFEDYARILKKLLLENNVDIAILGAAVSDYGLKKYHGKISSTEKDLSLVLTKNPKVIKSVKKWSKKPIFQVGFKLLSDVSEQKLIEEAYKSGLENGSDLTIANDLKKIRGNNREVIVITPDKRNRRLKGTQVASELIDIIVAIE